MKLKLSDLWRSEGTIGRGPYFLIGFLGFALKHNLDRLIATFYFHKPWDLFNYYIPLGRVAQIRSLPREDAWMFFTLLVLALPFIWVGVALTLRRLRAIGWPLWLVVLFFVPFGNLLFFIALSLIPSHPERSSPSFGDTGEHKSFLGKILPENPVGSAAIAIGLTIPFGFLMVLLGTGIFQRYGTALFVGLPFGLGLFSALLYSYSQPRTLGGCISVGLLSCIFLGFSLLALAIEGVMCIAMATPLALFLSLLGAIVGYFIQRRRPPAPQMKTALLLAALLMPASLTAEQLIDPAPPLFQNVTTVEIAAPPEKVWQEIIGFTEIPPPTEWLFRYGIAYPIRAKLDGQGVGAVRHCVFSTGEFVEPIEKWEEARWLKFSVSSQPAPMQEWTPYRNIHPVHLENYLRSTGGQFVLVPLDGGRTRVEATTWYYHHLWPAPYWQVLSDRIIHQIHRRVLNHIKEEAEKRGA
ncbi:MAG: hypothetical protein U1F57_01885 [bacterium]